MFRFLLSFVFAMFLSVLAPSAYSGTITATADPGGIITPAGTITVKRGGSQAFTISSSNPAEYVLVNVLVNGQSKGAITSYKFTKVGRTAKLSIYAQFKKIQQPVVAPPPPSEPIAIAPVPVAPTPTEPIAVVPVPVAPTPIAPTPVEPIAVAPVPVAPTPTEPIAVAPVPVAPTPIAPTPVEPIAVAPVPVAPTPTEPIAVVPVPVAPTPIAPTPVEPIAVAPVPVAPTPTEPIAVVPVPVAPTPIAPTPTPTPTPVEPAPTNTNIAVNLTWSVPTKMTNGDPLLLTNVVGYEVYYTSLDGAVSNVVTITSSTMTSAVVIVPTAGTYYFSIGTVAAQGEKSEMTDPIEVIVK